MEKTHHHHPAKNRAILERLHCRASVIRSAPLKQLRSLIPRVTRLLPLAAIIAAIAACDDPEQAKKPGGEKSLPRVEFVTVEQVPIATTRTWHATMEPLRIYEIIAPENGRVEEFPLDAGDTIAAGDLIAHMRFPTADARQADLQARLTLLKAEKSRLRDLVEKGSVSEATVAEAEIEALAARAELRGIEALLGEGEILAPSDGIVLETRVVAGSSIVEGTVLARIADAASIGVRLHIPNTETHYFENASFLKATTPDGEVHKIHRIIRQGSAGANLTQIECWLDATTAKSTGAVKIIHHSEREVLAVPWSSIANDDDRSWVARLDADDRVQRREVTPGDTSGTRVEISSGLEIDDRILLYQPRSHGEGTTVDPVKHGAEPATGND